MGQYTSYYLYQKYETRGEQEAIPVYPNVYSIDADGTRERIVKLDEDPQCGYVPPTPTPQYRWVNMPITQDYICDDCPTPTVKKLVANYSDGKVLNVDCNSDTELTLQDVRNHYNYNFVKMTSAVIGNCVTSIGDNAFGEVGGGSYCACYNLTSVTIPNSVTSIGAKAFFSCTSLTGVTIPDSVTSIGGAAFGYCTSFTSVTIPDSVTTIDGYAFNSCSGLRSATIGNGVTSIGDWTFYHCSSLTSVTLGNSVTSIGSRAFDSCSLTAVTIPNSVTTIGDTAFGACGSLTSVTIPDSVTSIGRIAFYGCSNLTSVTVNATTPPTLGDSVFSRTNECPILVPSQSLDAYKSASGWSSYADRIQPIS